METVAAAAAELRLHRLLGTIVIRMSKIQCAYNIRVHKAQLYMVVRNPIKLMKLKPSYLLDKFIHSSKLLCAFSMNS